MAESNTITTSNSNPQPQKPSVIVIGSGMAGVAAARTLSDASFNVTVLESRDRIGGRVHTDYSLGFPVDLGASWMHGTSGDNPLYAVIAQLRQSLYCTSEEDDSILYDHDLESYELYDLKGNQIDQDLVEEVGETFEKILDETEILRKECAEDIPISQAISMVVGRKPELTLEGLRHKVLQWFLCRLEGWFAADADTISLKCWDQETLVKGGHGIMVKGYFPVVEHLAKGLDIRLSHRVTKVERWCDGSVTVTVEDGTSFDADAAIVTVPLGVLKSNRIAFEPRLPEWKEEAIEELGIGIENKIVLQFDNVFWPNVELLGVVAKTSYKCSYFLNLHKATGYPVLVYMPAGKLARDIARLSDKEAADFAFSKLKKILPDASEPVQYLVSHWGSDENAMGSYSYDIVGQPHELYKRLRTPVDNLFFAGEATSSKFSGSVHGAYETGVKAAKNCRIRVLDPVFREELPVADVPGLLISRDEVDE